MRSRFSQHAYCKAIEEVVVDVEQQQFLPAYHSIGLENLIYGTEEQKQWLPSHCSGKGVICSN